ncbi:MAG TPA: hypothetical protein DCQ64_23980 [Candidatus Rokubacteria bacterium]|nr:hypothetical protein [Candidatus Rokubacteria bacterium]
MSRQKELNDKRREIYGAIVALTKEDKLHRPPSQSMVARRVCMTNTRTRLHLLALKAMGYINWEYGEERSLYVVKPLPAPAAVHEGA